MVIPPRTATTQDRTRAQRGPARRRIGPTARPPRTNRVALRLPEPPPEGAELPIDTLPPELAAVRKLLLPHLPLPPDAPAAMVLPRLPLARATSTFWSYLLR